MRERERESKIVLWALKFNFFSENPPREKKGDRGGGVVLGWLSVVVHREEGVLRWRREKIGDLGLVWFGLGLKFSK